MQRLQVSSVNYQTKKAVLTHSLAQSLTHSLTHLLTHSLRFKCHKVCAKQAPMSCGLSSELIKYFKHHVLQNSSAPSLENMIHQVQLNHHQKQQLHGQMRGRTTASVSSSTQNSPQTPPAGLSQRRLDAAELVEDEDGQFMIQNLTREPFNSEQYSAYTFN